MATDWQDAFDFGGDAGAVATEAVAEEEAPKRSRFFRRLRESLARSREALTAEVSASLFDRLDAEAFERLEEALILADVGAPTTAEVVGRLEAEVESGAVAGGEPARQRLIELLAELATPQADARIDL